MSKIAIVTGSSKSGLACIRELITRYGASFSTISAAARSADSGAKISSAPFFDKDRISVVVGVDAGKPETLTGVFEGASAALVVTPFDPAHGLQDDAKLNENMINAAVGAGVKHIVFVGSWTVHAVDQVRTIASRFAPTEALLESLKESKGITYTNLRAGYFTANFGHILPKSVKESNTVVLAQGVAVPCVHTDDIGNMAAAALANPSEHANKTYLVNGPAVVDAKSIAASLTKALGREITPVEVPKEKYTEHLPPFMKELVIYLAEKGVDAIPDRGEVVAITGKSKSFDDWLEENKQLFL